MLLYSHLQRRKSLNSSSLNQNLGIFTQAHTIELFFLDKDMNLEYLMAVIKTVIA